MRPIPSLAACAVAFALTLGVGAAEHCTGPSTTVPDATLATPAGTWYVDHVCSGPECWPRGLWIVEESNGIPGLQHDNSQIDDTCHWMIAGDRIIF